MLHYSTANTAADLNGILQLQRANHFSALAKAEASEEGFVTVVHDLPLLDKMNSPYPHIIARDGEKVVGYVLVMLKKWRMKIPVLLSMFEEIDQISYQGQLLKDTAYFVMGQVCIDKAYRGQGVFAGLYMEMSRLMKRHFDFIITEVSKSNMRSLRAHEKVGFEVVREYEEDGEDWVIVLLDLKKSETKKQTP